MSKIIFHKMHGCRNDFVIIDLRIKENMIIDSKINTNDTNNISYICNRNIGIGCDQLIIIEDSKNADFFMKIYNQDGSTALACGNASRCVASLFKANTIETLSGILKVKYQDENMAEVSMGKPNFFINKKIDLTKDLDEKLIAPALFLTMGNPHLVIFIKDLDDINLNEYLYLTDYNSLQESVNVSFAQIKNDHEINIKVIERGVGPTSSCGSAACATMAAALKFGFINERATIKQTGGDLEISSNYEGEIYMRGPVAYVFKGEIEL